MNAIEPMTDAEFLGYCEAHCETQRRLFSVAQVNRLFALVGEAPLPANPERWVPLGPADVLPLVQAARERAACGGYGED